MSQDIDAALWLQNDAAYLYREAAKARSCDSIAGDWLAKKIQVNAAHSTALARVCLGIK